MMRESILLRDELERLVAEAEAALVPAEDVLEDDGDAECDRHPECRSIL